MKKARFLGTLMLIVCMTGCGAASGGSASTSSENASVYTVEDFYVYNADGTIYNYPQDESIRIADNYEGIRNYYEELGEKSLELRTKRGVSAHSIGKMAFSEYDLNDFLMGMTKYPTFGSLDDEEKQKEKEFFEKYPDHNEAVKHTNEIKGYSLFIMLECSVDADGTVELVGNDGRNFDYVDSSKDKYDLYFYVRDDTVIQWEVEQKSRKE